jgi:hypothetical protein
VNFTEVVVSIDTNTVVERIAAMSHGVAGINRSVRLDGKFRYFWLASFDDATFPDVSQLRFNARNNPALQRYLHLGPEARQNDFYLFAPSGIYWQSAEYTYLGIPVQFICNFIIHASNNGDSGSRIEVIEIAPHVVVGKKLGLSAHTGPLPTVFHDKREVSPTTDDPLELLGVLQRALAD